MHFLDYLSFTIYIFLLIYVIIISRQKQQTAKSFALDDQSTPGLIVFATLTASFLGPGYTMGLSEQGYKTGFLFFFVYLGFSLQSLLVGYFVAPKLKKYNDAQTVGDIMGFHYGKFARVFTGIMSLLFSIGIIGLISFITGSIFHTIFHIPRAWGTIIGSSIVIVYSTFGGMRTVVFTDVLQFIFLTISIPILLLSIFFNTPDVGTIIETLPNEVLNPFQNIGIDEFFGLFLGFIFGETLIPPSINRAFIAKSTKDARKGFLFSGIYSVIWFGMCIVIGIIAQHALPNITADTSFMEMAKVFLPVGILGILLAAVSSIIMSTQDSYLNAASVVFVRDLVNFIKPNLTDKQYLIISKTATIIFGVLGILFALQLRTILDGIMINYTLWGPTIVIPLVIAIMSKNKLKPIAGMFAMILGVTGVIIWEWVLNKPYDIPSLVAGLTLNILGFVLFSLIGSSSPKWKILQSSTGMNQTNN